ncbi:MAG: hypothetical protein K2Q09_04045 [Phycisphaerales bacterium]|nr:hypothetical protein [Phycisphaerales bacterium]
MKTAFALILMIVGTAMMLGGFAWAVFELAGLYKSNLDDGINSTADPRATSSAMLTAAGVGLVGFIPATIGSIMLGKGIVARIVKKMAKSEP